MDRGKLKLLFHTLKYLKRKQIFYRGYYLMRNKLFKPKYNISLPKAVEPTKWEKHEILYSNSFTNGAFKFLNLSKSFEDNIDWNYNAYGKLWTYNLCYFDFLNQEKGNTLELKQLIADFITKHTSHKDALEPFPISLRGINWIKFLSKNGINETKINTTLYSDYYRLSKNLEYHLLGNHVLENGFSMLFGAYYFKDEEFYHIAKKILKEELKEQILDDGAHFELSPMYHKIMLHRVLDCISLIQQNNWKTIELLQLLKQKAEKMLSWLQTISFRNTDLPMVNDCAYDIAPSTKALFNYAKSLNISWDNNTNLKQCGYRKLENKRFELFMDVGKIGPSYQPGHAHADTLSFVLYIDDTPVIVDTGTSTYEKNARRQQERSTAAHNTIQLDNFEQSQVWGGFRVANRAEIVELEENNNQLSATHNGYKNLGVLHERSFTLNESSVVIKDQLSKPYKGLQKAYFHLDSELKNVICKESQVLFTDKNVCFCFDGALQIKVDSYDLTTGFNQTIKSKKLIITFNQYLKTTISS